MNALAVMSEARALGVTIEAVGDKIKARRSSGIPPSFVEKLRVHKPELLRLLAGNTDADLPARARQRVRAACELMKIDPVPILRQFDYWKYPESDLRELIGWPDEMLQAHIELLVHEIGEGVRA